MFQHSLKSSISHFLSLSLHPLHIYIYIYIYSYRYPSLPLSLPLYSLGLDILMFYSLFKKRVFVMIKASVERLRSFADKIGFLMLLDSKVAEECALNGDVECNISPIHM